MTEDIAYISEKIDLCFNMHDKIIQAIRLDRSDNFPKSITDEILSLYQETKKTIATSLIPEQLKKDTIGIISADLKIFKADLNAPICDRKQFLEKRFKDSMQSQKELSASFEDCIKSISKLRPVYSVFNPNEKRYFGYFCYKIQSKNARVISYIFEKARLDNRYGVDCYIQLIQTGNKRAISIINNYSESKYSPQVVLALNCLETLGMLTESGKDNLLTQKKRNNELNGIAYSAMNNTESKDSTRDYNGDYWKDLKG